MTTCNHCNYGNHHDLPYCIDNIPMFHDLLQEDKEEIMNASNHKSYEKGEFIFLPGDTSDDLFVVNKGMVKVLKTSELGKEQILQILEPGDFVGELALFNKTVHKTAAMTLTDTEICIIQGSTIRNMIIKKPEISLKFLKILSQRLEESEVMIEQIGLKDVEQRIANYLLIEIEKNQVTNKDGEYEINLPVSKGDLAALIGTTQETLSRKLTLFQDRGWIKQKGQRVISLIDIDSLEDLR